MDEAQIASEDAGRPQRRDARENRETLLEVAKRLFAQQSVEATSMAEIAREAGVGQGTLYRHFADKSAVCQGLIEEDLQAFQGRVGALLDAATNTSPLQRLITLLTEKTLLMESHLPLFAAMDEGGQRRGPGEFYVWQQERIGALLEEAIARDELPPVDVPFVTSVVLVAVSPQSYRRQRHYFGWSNERIVAGLRQLIIDVFGK